MPSNSASSASDIFNPLTGKKLLRRLLWCCTTAACGAGASSAYGVGLGEVVTHSVIGELFKAEVPLKLSAGEQIDASCISFAPMPQNDTSDVPWITNGKLSIRQSETGLVLQISARPIHHPAVMLGIMVRCGVSLRRDYALLLDPPSTSTTIEPGTMASSDVTKIETPKQQAKPRLETPPADVLKQSAATTPVAKEIRDRKASSKIDTAPPVTKTRAGASSKRDRLFVSEAGEGVLRLTTTIGQRPEMSEPERTKLKAELQLIAALDEKNAQHIELKERIKQLESLRTRLMAEAANLEGELKLTQSSASEKPSVAPLSTGASIPVEALTSAPLTTVSAPAKPEVTLTPWYKNTYALLLLLVVIAGVVAAFILQRSKKRGNGAGELPLAYEQPVEAAAAPPPLPTEGDPLMEPLTEADIWPEIPEPPSSATVRAIEGAIGPLSGAVPSSLLHADGEDEHDSAVELADIMMSFGRVQGAAQTLADFIRANPKQAVKPWMKLLEVYRVANMRMEFEALTTQMNKTFNVQPVPWDDFEIALHAPESLENLDHIRAQLCELWGQRECQAYLHQLLRDNRQGTRQGFPLAIVDEVLLLLSVLEAQLGPFKPDARQTSLKPAESEATDSGFLMIPPVETLTIPTPQKSNKTPEQVSAVHQEAPLSLARSLDFDLIDMDMLSKTLHINLDELTEPPPPEEINK